MLVVISLGVALSVSLAVPLSHHLAWEAVLGVFGAIGLLGAIAWSIYGRTGSTTQDASKIFSLREVWQVFRNRTIFLLVVGDALVFINYAAVTSWLPAFLHEFRGMTLERAGYITGLLPSIGVVAVLVGGYLTLKIKARRPFFIVPGIMVGIGAFGAFLFTDTTAIYVSVILLGIGTWVYQPILLTLPMQLPWMTPAQNHRRLGRLAEHCRIRHVHLAHRRWRLARPAGQLCSGLHHLGAARLGISLGRHSAATSRKAPRELELTHSAVQE